MKKAEIPERIRLVKRNGIFDSQWYYPDAAIMPFEAEAEYVHIDRLATARQEAELDFVTDLIAVADAADVQKLTTLITRSRDRRRAALERAATTE